jgi:hypothetical protein
MLIFNKKQTEEHKTNNDKSNRIKQSNGTKKKKYLCMFSRQKEKPKG